MEEREQKLEEPEAAGNYKETVFQTQRAVAHMKSQCLLKCTRPVQVQDRHNPSMKRGGGG